MLKGSFFFQILELGCKIRTWFKIVKFQFSLERYVQIGDLQKNQPKCMFCDYPLTSVVVQFGRSPRMRKVGFSNPSHDRPKSLKQSDKYNVKLSASGVNVAGSRRLCPF